MTKLQKITLILGCSGILINILALGLHLQSLGYTALFLGRASGFAYMVALDRFRASYLLPIAVSAINCFYNTEFLIFAELLSASIVYQYSAFKTFNKQNVLSR